MAALLLARQHAPLCEALLAGGGPATAAAMVSWAGRLERAAGWLPQTHALAATRATVQLGAPPVAACRRLLAWAQLLVGLFGSSWLVWLLERRSRRAFLVQVRGAPLVQREWQGGGCAGACAEQTGLGGGEGTAASRMLQHAATLTRPFPCSTLASQ